MEIPSYLRWLDGEPLKRLHSTKLSLIENGAPLLDMCMINPDLDPPRILLDRLAEASLKSGAHRYAVSRGVRKLRAAFSKKYRQRFAVSLDPEREVCVTMGAKDALLHALMCMAEPGDGILIGAPYYPAYLSVAKILKLNVSLFSLGSNEQQMLEDISKRCREGNVSFLLLNFPSNPGGLKVSKSFYEKVLLLSQEYDFFIINDFVYGEMDFETGFAPSLLAVEGALERCVEIYSLSKAYNVPGWCVGALLGNQQVVSRLSKLKSHIDYGTFLPIQAAAQVALNSDFDYAAVGRECYRTRAAVLGKGLVQLGWQVCMPSAGASIWAEMPPELHEYGAEKVTQTLLQSYAVAALPGTLFGEDFANFVRFSLVLPEEKLRRALERISEFQRKLIPDEKGTLQCAV